MGLCYACDDTRALKVYNVLSAPLSNCSIPLSAESILNCLCTLSLMFYAYGSFVAIVGQSLLKYLLVQHVDVDETLGDSEGEKIY